ncbi:MAG TPA: 3-deoxy-8-phosphooctulonate synthase, partial [Thermoanaerobaculia bacterium]|nr:3-deoxy-8-phosphooctulonate synthase [Thermoanaerobaculia bacterium]
MTRTIAITSEVSFGGDNPPLFMAGPCVIESREHALMMARTLLRLRDELQINLVFKSSFDKANRSSVDSFRGPGLKEGLEILRAVKKETGLPLISDIHEPQQAAPAAEVLDILQIPAFLCRQTDLIAAAARTGKAVAVK